MTWLAQLLADEDFRNGATVIGVIVAGAVVIVVGDKILTRVFPNTPRSTEEAFEAAGIEITATQGDYIPDLRKPHYPNRCGCADCQPDEAPAISRAARRPRPYANRWLPTDAEIEQFLNDQTRGNPR